MSPFDVITFFFWILSEILNKIRRKILQRFRMLATLKFLLIAKSMLLAYLGDKMCWWRIRDVGDDIGHFCHQNLLFFYVSVWPNVSLRSLTKMIFSPGSTKDRTEGIRTVRPVRQFLIFFLFAVQSVRSEQSNSEHLLFGVRWTQILNEADEKFVSPKIVNKINPVKNYLKSITDFLLPFTKFP